LIYVDNTAVRSNCETLVRRFHTEVRNDGSIDLSFYWQSYLVLLGVRYSYDELTDLGSIPISEKPDLVYIFKFQKMIGELMFLVVNASPEISYALSVLWSYLTQTTLQHGIHTNHLLCYRRCVVRSHAKLSWCSGKVNPPFKQDNYIRFKLELG
jgi:hypothetical protein